MVIRLTIKSGVLRGVSSARSPDRWGHPPFLTDCLCGNLYEMPCRLD